MGQLHAVWLLGAAGYLVPSPADNTEKAPVVPPQPFSVQRYARRIEQWWKAHPGTPAKGAHWHAEGWKRTAAIVGFNADARRAERFHFNGFFTASIWVCVFILARDALRRRVRVAGAAASEFR